MAQRQPSEPQASEQQPERATETDGHINGIDMQAMNEAVEMIKADPSKGMAEFSAKSSWQGGLKSESHIDEWKLGGESIQQDYTIEVDEPTELVGGGSAPNPQMLLQTAINTCMLNTFVAAASVMGVELESVEFESNGELDLRGFLGIDESIDAGYHDIQVHIRVKGDGTREQYEKMWQVVQKQSPNYFNTTQPVDINANLEIMG